MIISEDQLQRMVDRHVSMVLREGIFGSALKSVFNGVRNAAQSDFTRNVGNIIGNGLGDEIHNIATGNIGTKKYDNGNGLSFDAWMHQSKKNRFDRYDANTYCMLNHINDENRKKEIQNFFDYCKSHGNLAPDTDAFEEYQKSQPRNK